MLTFDLHYHTNVYMTRQTTRRRRLARHRQIMEKNSLDFIASTEHGYKKPFEAYLYLADIAANLSTHIIPAVEAVSEEGVDIIFLYRDENDLRCGLKSLKPFEWSVWDMKAVAQATGAISIIAHPFTPGTSGIVTQTGVSGFRRLLPQADYVEAHNGSGLFLMRTAEKKSSRVMGKTYRQKSMFTAELPSRFIPGGIGTTISSDAHFPEHQLIVGEVDLDENRKADWFGLLQQRIRFTHHLTALYHDTDLTDSKDRKTLAMLRCVLGEAIYKKRLKTQASVNRLRS